MSTTTSTPAVFVLVHGAWHGGWCWARVAQRLRALGHQVYTPTQTGVGERKHLLNTDITLNTFVQDIANVLLYEDLQQVILVGHSFGGLAITGVADLMPERIQQLVYLDAFLLESGVTVLDTLPDQIAANLKEAAKALPIPALMPPKPQNLGFTEANDIAFVETRLTPQPLGVYESSLQLQYPIGNGLPCTYVHCVEPVFKAVQGSANWAKKQASWTWEELADSHVAIMTNPDKVSALLHRLVR
ncbi:alpha/beta fold hydrolase [Alcaligenaceae bacterium]|nr:alpha/beta fold hydrolase [Alcaligenaceae bacterium]